MRTRLDLCIVAASALASIIPARGFAQHNRVAPVTWTPDAPLRAPPTIVSVPASGLSVVTLPVPTAFAAAADVAFTITPTVPGAILGQLAGRIAPDASPRSIVFAVRAPRYAPAGRMTVAVVELRGATQREDVPVIADVAPVRGVIIAMAAGVVASTEREPLRMPFRLTSTGNAPDTIALEVLAPAGWSVRDLPAAVPLMAGQSVDGAFTLLPPPAVTGTGTVRLIAMSRGASVAQAGVEVRLPAASSGATPGPVLRTGVAAAVGPWEGTSTLQSIAIDGPLSDGLSLRARASSAPGSDAANYALSRAGSGRTPFALHLASPAWSLEAGTLGASMTGLSGVNLVGRGGSFAVYQPRWSAGGFVLDPDVGGADAHGALAAARFEYSPGALTLLATGSRLRETRSQLSRSLDAVSMGGALQAAGARLGAEVARRQYGGITAAGWSATLARRTPIESFDIRYTQAPGGSGAFARASRELSISAQRRIANRLDVNGGVWHSADNASATRTGLTIDGWNAGAQLDLFRDVRVLLTARDASFGATTPLGVFSSGERALDASLDVRRSLLLAQVTAGVARLERRTATRAPETVDVTRNAPRVSVRGELALGGTAGTVGLTGQFDRTGAGVGAAPRQWSFGARIDGHLDAGLPRPVRVDAGLERVGGPLGAYRSLGLRAGVEADAGPTTIRLSAERNPFVVPAATGSPWMYLVMVSHAVTLPRVGHGGTRGQVYRDLNGNGRRDRGESGFAGVLLRRDGDVAVTNRDGAFTLPGDPSAPYEVDARSLPLGWTVPSTVVAGGTRAIGAIALASLDVELVVDSADRERVAPADLAVVLVMLRDSLGRTWEGRRVSETRLVFDAVPPGSYEIVVDGSRSRESLRPVGDVRAAVSATARNRVPIRIVLRARPLRFSSPGSGGFP